MSANDLETVLDELAETMRAVDPGGLRALEERLGAARRVFVAGAGRSGLVVRAFAMRLMHLGLDGHMVGDMTTPALGEGDLLVVSAGPGSFSTVKALVGVAHDHASYVTAHHVREQATARRFDFGELRHRDSLDGRWPSGGIIRATPPSYAASIETMTTS